MKRINIYLDMKDKKKLDEIKYKYHLSYSTIINIVGYVYLKTKEEKNDGWHFLYKELQEIYINQKKGLKTSIKPKIYKDLDGYLIEKPSLYFTNCIHIFLNNKLKELHNEKIVQKTQNEIYNLFQNTYEENWDGNRFQRIMPRILKQNREYYKRILENE